MIKAFHKVVSKDEWEGEGATGAIHNEKMREVAIKAIAKKRLDIDMIRHIQEEVKILNTLDHPNIIKYYEDFENDKFIFLVMEHC